MALNTNRQHKEDLTQRLENERKSREKLQTEASFFLSFSGVISCTSYFYLFLLMHVSMPRSIPVSPPAFTFLYLLYTFYVYQFFIHSGYFYSASSSPLLPGAKPHFKNDG